MIGNTINNITFQKCTENLKYIGIIFNYAKSKTFINS